MRDPAADVPVDESPDVPITHVVSVLRERLYGAISCLATLAVLARYTAEDTSGWVRVLDVGISAGGLWAASLLAEYIAHLGAQGHAPRGRDALRMLQSSGQILQAAAIPVLILGVGAVGWLATSTALWIASWFLVIELGFITWLAVRRADMRWWQRIIAVTVLAAAGAAVVIVKMVAH
ncbi:hypothetical protein [Mycolicibacterium litorale]|uniref:hypothetical protein n=1 Tax=Mycolicibacterium litorale TaxID=758802 RepID=UPI0039A2AE8C